MTNELSIDERLEVFRRLDFEGFNKQDWETFNSIHTDDVLVEIQGERTEGIDPHTQGAKELCAHMPDTHIEEYLIAAPARCIPGVQRYLLSQVSFAILLV